MRYNCKLIFLIIHICNLLPIITVAQSNYNIHSRFSANNKTIESTIKVDWHNRSNVALDRVPFKFEIDSLSSGQVIAKVNGVKSRILLTTSLDGFNGFYVVPNEPIKAGSINSIEIYCETQNYKTFMEGVMIFSNPYPLIPYFESGVFNPNYQVHSEYNVEFNLPKGFQIAATGSILQRDTINGSVTVKTYAKDVPWYGFTLFRNDIKLLEKIESGVVIRSFYFEDDKKWGVKLSEYAVGVINFYINKFGFYPQPVINIIPGYDKPYGGWPVCPNIVGIHRGIDRKKENADTHAEWIMAHEIGHQYWGFNYILEPLNYPQWFGISMGIYADYLYTINKGLNKNHNTYFFRDYTDAVQSEINTKIMQSIESLNMQNIDWNNIIMHGKSWAVLRLLEKEIGEDAFLKVYMHILENYKGANVTPEIFKGVCEKLSGANLEAFFNVWLYSNDYLEYKVKSVKLENPESLKHNYTITISKKGTAGVSSVDVLLIFNSGKKKLLTFKGSIDEVILTCSSSEILEEVVIDPEVKLPLINRVNWLRIIE